MSTPAEVLRDVGSFVDAMSDLLNTTSMQQLPEIADQVGAGQQLNSAIGLTQSVIARIVMGIRLLHQSAVDADALVALLAIVPPVVGGIGDVVRTSGETLAEMALGLDDIATVSTAVVTSVNSVSNVLQYGIDTAEAIVSVVPPTALARLISSLETVSFRLGQLKARTSDARQGMALPVGSLAARVSTRSAALTARGIYL